MAEDITRRLIEEGGLSREEYVQLLTNMNPDVIETVKNEAVKIRKLHYGNKVYVRGLIEFTNYCKNNCYYCGIRGANKKTNRYRLTREDILACCSSGYRAGFRTFVLQGGEDPYFTDERMEEIIRAIKERYPDCALTLSIGERSYESYKRLKEAGANRYLLRHETADKEHYRALHPEAMSLANRMRCLYDLKKLGYQTGAGFMVGSPYQTLDSLAEDLVFLKKLEPEMVGIGPFIPHHDTKFASCEKGSIPMTLFLLSIVRIILPKVLLPATTALGTADLTGREKGIMAGANVVMPNLSPMNLRKSYDLYDNKISSGEEGAECIEALRKNMASIGYQVVTDRGDAIV